MSSFHVFLIIFSLFWCLVVPIMHFLSAGLDFDVATISGKPAVIERWSYPKDGSLKEFSDKMSDKFKNPKPISSIKADDYVALFVPGGHGSMLGLPENDKVGALMATMMKQDKFVAALCHGPAALLAAPKETFAGYKLCIFPDSVDKQSPMIGYLPGQLPWFQGEKLEQHGMELTNKTASSVTGAVHKDRQVITGDSPLACNPFGKLMVDSILESLKK
jgi:D-lactate dehydratase / protein deglycase